MRIPRDLSGADLIRRLNRFGYVSRHGKREAMSS